MMAIELTFTNQSTTLECGEIKVGATRLAAGMAIHPFPGILSLAPGQAVNTTLGIDFRDTTQPAKFDLVINNRPQAVMLQVPTGEMLRPVRMSEKDFSLECGKLRGMCEARGKAKVGSHALDTPTITNRVYKTANILQVPSSDLSVLQFAGRTLAHKHNVLITLQGNKAENTEDGVIKEIIVNAENIVIGSMLLKELKASLEQ